MCRARLRSIGVRPDGKRNRALAIDEAVAAVTEPEGSPVTIYYSVAVWSEGNNGVAIPGWQPWENTCATLYHELNEARTDPDVEDAVRTGEIRWIGWNSQSGQEIGDFPIHEAGPNLPLVFKKVP